eukprot:scaffold363505_cov22-Prasinocladus_malaysianus.AAC.1
MRGVAAPGRALASIDANAATTSGWQAVGGLTEAVAAVQGALELASLAAGWVDAAPLRLRTGLLLYGPPRMRQDTPGAVSTTMPSSSGLHRPASFSFASFSALVLACEQRVRRRCDFLRHV